MRPFNALKVFSFVASFHTLACGGAELGESEAELAVQQEELRCSPFEDGQVVDLGLLEENPLFSSVARALNRRATVVGYGTVRYSPELSPSRGFRWRAETGFTRLQTLGGATSFAVDINDREEVVGSAELPNGYLRAAVWDAAGGVRDLGTLGGNSSSATGINRRGEVIGLSDDAAGSTRPFIWDARRGMVELPLPSGTYAYLNGINDAGVVVGTWVQEDGTGLPFKWTRRDGPTPLELLGGTLGEAWGINDRGDIVGYVIREGTVTGMKWTGRRSRPTVLEGVEGGTQPWPLAINDRGAAVGGDMLPGEQYVAAAWHSGSRGQLLPVGPDYYSQAFDINDRGQIVGYSGMSAFLWEPSQRHCRR